MYIHKVHIGNDCSSNYAYNGTNHTAHYFLNDEHTDDEHDKASYVISEIIHIEVYLKRVLNCVGIGVSNSIGLPVTG